MRSTEKTIYYPYTFRNYISKFITIHTYISTLICMETNNIEIQNDL